MTLLSAIVIGTSAPIVAMADTIDSKINESTNKIETLKGQKQEAEAALAQINAEVAELETEVQTTLDKKVALEIELNELNAEIAELEKAIDKRTDKITEQARAAQINGTSSRYLDIVLEADSLSDAINRSWAYGKLVSANNDIVTAQKDDKEALAEKKTKVDNNIVAVNKVTEQLKVKQEEVTTKQYDQAILTKEVEASLSTEETKKVGLLAEKKEAEKRKAEAARIAKEEADKKAAAAAAIAKENEQKEAAVAKEIESINTQAMPDDPDNQPGTGNNNKPQPGSGDFKWPLPSITITSGYGNRPDPNGVSGNGHDGIDMAGSLGDNVYASRGGTVVSSTYDPSGGNLVIIQHDNGYYTYYLHLNSFAVSSGQQVDAGDVVGHMGTTGNSTGVHLHFGISTGVWSGFMDPGPFLGLY